MNYALIVGIDHYEKKGLKGAVNDAQAFAAWLKDSGQISASQQDDHMRVLLSTPDNRYVLDNDIDRAAHEIIAHAQKHKSEPHRLYFYFSGHGIGISFSKTALCLRDWYQLPNCCISSMEYKDGFINTGLFHEVIFILDCCRQYDFLTETKKPGFNYKTKVEGRHAGNTKVFIAYSTRYGKLSYEINEKDDDNNDLDKHHGAFTTFLLEGLKGDADEDGDGKINAKDLQTYIHRNFSSYATSRNKVQDADTDMNGASCELVICDVPAKSQPENFIITFSNNRQVQLTDGNLYTVIQSGSVMAGDQWALCLEAGMYLLKDLQTGDWKILTNLNPNTLSYATF
ncbi:hypothetical protein F0L74_27160 [Chitinophaga agrisoli]|uniref:Peptidase C14 caspase domain-containing protein n=1 Tax=Chitinophaga agrisoli TaxID=2607653 RepID=A0A5B2VME9_9BACT|nr:caspase family protein [Chitinophaga agrisoli]KAA2239868.1 hypothetical protein F0L74_27160 [Chitinophaga agrisoli]